MANDEQRYKASTLNQCTMSPANDSSYHIYEMTEMPDEEMTEMPDKEMTEMPDEEMTEMPAEEMAEIPNEEMTQIPYKEEEGTGKPQGPQEAPVSATDETPSIPPYRKRTASSWGSNNYRQRRKSPHRQHALPRRYNTVSEYEFMMPQLQAAARAVKEKHTKSDTTLPANKVDDDDAYSEIDDDNDDAKPQQSDDQSDPTYIFMRTEEPEQFSSFLSKWFDTDKDTNVENINKTIDQPLSQVSEEDVYITMQ